jgi:S-DNA-T family DNA segregation ATPase FtsK/SpoIIIE
VPERNHRVERVVATGMADDTARRCARALARFEDTEVAVAGAGLPAAVRLLPLLDHVAAGADLDADAVLARWAAAGIDPAPRAPVGVAEDGVFTVDLHADGPHALVGGTTGSGKSELLRTLVAGLAAGVDPDHLTFVLVDFKGGSAFDECARLPHTVGMVTDLDEHLAERALRCLDAELRHRERILRAAGAADLPSYLRGGRGAEPLPRLVVVIDEFATLKAELPDFVDALVGVAQRGRSLGVHMVLATQRPSGAVSENIRANTNLRIALRVQDEGDSTDIIDRPDAARLPRHAAGRAYVRLGAGEVVAIQTALATARRTGGPVAPVDLAPFAFGPVPRAPVPEPPADAPTGAPAAGPPGSHAGTPVDGPTDGGAGGPGEQRETDLGVLVAAVAEAHGRTGRPAPRRPWPDPLPPVVDLDGLLAAAPPPAPNGAAALPEVPLALADDPDGQAQYPVGWRPDDGNLVVYGVGGAGTTTALGTVALSLAQAHPPDRLHLYALDFGAGELGVLAGLAHTGAVIGAPERERQMRLVRHLRAELDRRRLLAAGERAGEPAIVVLVDGWAAFDAEYRDLVGSGVMDDVQRVFADGPEVGIHMVVAADRTGAVPSTMASLVRQKLLMRLADPYDYAQFGIAAKAVPDLPPGGAMLAEAKQVVQVAMPAGGLAAAVDRCAAAHPPPDRPPAPIGQLPADVAVDDVGATAELEHRPWLVPVGIGEGDLGPARLVVHEGEHALVAGPGRSGKTSALAAVAESCRAARPDLAVVVVAPPRSPLPTLVGPDHHVRPDELDAALPPVEGRPTLLLVDDADAVEDPTGVLEDLLAAHHPDLLVVAAGRAENLRGSFGHWTRALRRSKLGVLLQPHLDLDGELLGVTLPRRLALPMTAGRGLLANGGELEIVQIARPAART